MSRFVHKLRKHLSNQLKLFKYFITIYKMIWFQNYKNLNTQWNLNWPVNFRIWGTMSINSDPKCLFMGLKSWDWGGEAVRI